MSLLHICKFDTLISVRLAVPRVAGITGGEGSFCVP